MTQPATAPIVLNEADIKAIRQRCPICNPGLTSGLPCAFCRAIPSQPSELSKIEQVAIALVGADGGNWNTYAETSKAYWRKLARAAIGALKNPSPGQLKLAEPIHTGLHIYMADSYDRLLSAILTEGK